jgi:hypothetical protein
MELKGSLPCSTEPASEPYTEHVQFSPNPRTLFYQDPTFPSGFLAKIVYAFLISPTSATFPTHLILFYFILMFGEEYKP